MLVTPVREAFFEWPNLNKTLEAPDDGSALLGPGSSDFDGETKSGTVGVLA